jgi:Fe-S cluster assembly ATPase SufC
MSGGGYNFRRMQLDNIGNNKIHIVMGKRGSGKTTLAQNIAGKVFFFSNFRVFEIINIEKIRKHNQPVIRIMTLL